MILCYMCWGGGKLHDRYRSEWVPCKWCNATGKLWTADYWSPYPGPPDNGFVKEAE